MAMPRESEVQGDLVVSEPAVGLHDHNAHEVRVLVGFTLRGVTETALTAIDKPRL